MSIFVSTDIFPASRSGAFRDKPLQTVWTTDSSGNRVKIEVHTDHATPAHDKKPGCLSRIRAKLPKITDLTDIFWCVAKRRAKHVKNDEKSIETFATRMQMLHGVEMIFGLALRGEALFLNNHPPARFPNLNFLNFNINTCNAPLKWESLSRITYEIFTLDKRCKELLNKDIILRGERGVHQHFPMFALCFTATSFLVHSMQYKEYLNDGFDYFLLFIIDLIFGILQAKCATNKMAMERTVQEYGDLVRETHRSMQPTFVDPNNNECPICFENFFHNQSWILPKQVKKHGGHAFHAACLARCNEDKYPNQPNRCPQCNSNDINCDETLILSPFST